MIENQKYNTALQIENDSDLFSYGMSTDIGYAFVYGDLKAVDTVTYPEIDGKYMYIEKVKEKYTMHTRTKTYYTGSGKHRKRHTKTEIYWTWDKVSSENKKCKEISFCGNIFDSSKLDIPSSEYIKTIKESSKIRYKYYGVSNKYTGTIFTELKEDIILNNTKFYENYTIQETIEYLEFDFNLFIFWIFWILFIVLCVYGFYYLDNKWLEN